MTSVLSLHARTSLQVPTPPNFKQQLTGVIGQPIAENPSQAMVEAAYRHHGLPWRYLTIEVSPAGLRDAVLGARAMGFRGFNCTIPHKVAVIPHLDGLGDSAALMGAVNCVVRRGDQLIGENTDGKGFVQSLKDILDPSGTRIVILGAGGAARAIAVELAIAGASSITIVNRNPERGADLVSMLRTRVRSAIDGVAWHGDYAIPKNIDVVVNATSIGLYPDGNARLPIDISSLQSRMVIADVIPNPPRTRFIRDAQERGCRVIDGLGMLVNQGVIGIKYWTNIDPDPAVMRKSLEDIFLV